MNTSFNTSASVYNGAIGGPQIANLSFTMCLLLDLKRDELDCSRKNNICVSCRIAGGYFSGESVEAVGGQGHQIVDILWALTMMVGVVGILANLAIIAILGKRKAHSQQSFDYMLMILACFDIICCIGNGSAATFLVAFGDGWINRGRISLLWLLVSYLTQLFGRSASVFMTVLIALERYLKVAFPIRSRNWFTPRATKFFVFLVLLIALGLNVPRDATYAVTDNIYGPQGADIHSLKNFDSIITSNMSWIIRIQLAAIDFVLPLPILLVLNCLTFYEIRKFYRRRAELNMNQKREINSAKLFLPVIVVLLVCNFGPVTHYVTTKLRSVLYRELDMLFRLSIMLNIAANFPIYYMWCSAFREDFKSMFSNLCVKLKPTKPKRDGTSGGLTGSSDTEAPEVAQRIKTSPKEFF